MSTSAVSSGFGANVSSPRAQRRVTRFAVMLAAAMIGSGGCADETTERISYSKPPQEPTSEFDKASNPEPTAKTMYAMARILQGQGADARCAMVLHNIITKHREFLPAYADLADIQVKHGKIGLAIETLAAGLKVSKRDPVLYNNLGMCLMLKGEFDRAMTCFTRAAALNPQDARFRANMAAALGMLGRYDESLALYQQVLPSSDARHNLRVIRDARVKLALADQDPEDYQSDNPAAIPALAELHARPKPNTPASVHDAGEYVQKVSLVDLTSGEPILEVLPHQADTRPSEESAHSNPYLPSQDPGPIEAFAGSNELPAPREKINCNLAKPPLPPPSHTQPSPRERRSIRNHDLEIIRRACRDLVVVRPGVRVPHSAGPADSNSRTTSEALSSKSSVESAAWTMGQESPYLTAAESARSLLSFEYDSGLDPNRFVPTLDFGKPQENAAKDWKKGQAAR